MKFQQKISKFIQLVQNQIPLEQLDPNTKQNLLLLLEDFFKELYLNIPKNFLNFTEGTITNEFMSIYFQENGLEYRDVKKIPEILKPRLYQLIGRLNQHYGSKHIFKLFHEVVEEFYPELNIYTIDVIYDNELKFKLNPVYISDEDSIEEFITKEYISTNFLMNIHQFLDDLEKPSNLYPTDLDKARIINLFPIKTGILHIQTNSKIKTGTLDTLKNMVGATESSKKLIPIAIPDFNEIEWVPFDDSIKLLWYIKFKELEFNSTYLYINKTFWKYRNFPFIRNKEYFSELLQKQYDTGISWKEFFHWEPERYKNFVLNSEDYLEAKDLLNTYNGLQHDYFQHKDFKERFLKLRKTDERLMDTSMDIIKLRQELVGNRPKTYNDLKSLILYSFDKKTNGVLRDNLKYIVDLYEFSKDQNGQEVIEKLLNYNLANETKEFISQYNLYGGTKPIPNTLQDLEVEIYDWYKKFNLIDTINKTEAILLKNFQYELEYVNLDLIVDKIVSILEKERIITIEDKYSKIIEFLDEKVNELTQDIINGKTIDKTWFPTLLMELQKPITINLSSTDEMKSFWNDFFQNMIYGGSMKDYIYDPILFLFHEYWFSSEQTSQNTDTQRVLSKDKLDNIVLGSVQKKYINKKEYDHLQFTDLVKIMKTKDSKSTVLRDDTSESTKVLTENSILYNIN